MSTIRATALTCGFVACTSALAVPVGTTFTYQGLLKNGGQAATGLYDLQVCVFEDPSTPVPLACAPDFDNVPVEDGVFTVNLDFGNAAFAGELRFLELRVRPGAGGAYTILAPRQAIRPAPEALRAATSSAAPWSGLSGVPSGFADGVDNDTNSGGTVTSIASGAGLTGGPITGAGTIAIAAGGVQQSMLATNAVGTSQLQDDAVGTTKIADDSVRLVKLTANSVDSARVVNGSLVGADLAPSAIGLAQIDTEQVQARVAGTCAAGEYFRGIQRSGAIACEPVPGLTVTTTLDAGAAVVGTYNDIAILPDGRPVVSYYDATNGNLKLARCANTACTGTPLVTTIDSSANDVGQFSAIAIGADGLPVVSYYDTTADDLRVLKCGNADCSSGNTSNIVDATGNVGQLGAIAIGLDGNPVIAYYLFTGPFFYDGDYKVAKCANPACSGAASITVFDTNGAASVASQIGIAVPVDGLPVIAYQVSNAGTSAVLWAAKCANAACTGTPTRTAVHSDAGFTIGNYAALAVSAANRPAIAYTGSGGQLALARCLNASCSSSAFDVVPNADASYMDIAIGPDGIPVVSQQNPASDDLVVTRCLGSDCAQAGTEVFVLQAAVDGNGGAHTSIAIGNDGLPVIAFEAGGDLRVVKCGNRSCQ